MPEITRNHEALHELLLAKRLDPLADHGDYPGILAHLGLEDEAKQALEEGLRTDPTSKSYADLVNYLPFLRGDADTVLSMPVAPGKQFLDPWVYLQRGRLDEARKALDERLPQAPEAPFLRLDDAIYLALKGEPASAEAEVVEVLATPNRQGQAYHHTTYSAACVYAIDGKSDEAVKFLRRTAETGFPNYPLFNRDPFLDHIRTSPEFIEFLSEQKSQWESFRREYYGQN